ncbi:proteasome subunit beta type 7, putative [Eimeria brunetti]|uniref:Proteasome subunit beta n=1 Tax=Eimeria brunetti TaxID=51314 RepID=U6LW81_9EIME|nr:proteasome subunit beta type 7, putative [Eimeria brunetti]
MGSIEQLQRQRGGFDFSNHSRNVSLLLRAAAAAPPSSAAGAAAAAAAAAGEGAAAAAGVCSSMPPLRKTGTTICGVVFKGGVVLGADTRATEGPLVADKNCNKLHRISSNIYAAGAGTAADLDHMVWGLGVPQKPRVSMAVCVLSQELFKYQGYRGCAVVLGGYDIRGPSLYKIHPHGSTDTASFAAMGSGSLNAMAVLEAEYKDGMTEEEARALVCKAITAGVMNDLGSGGNVDLAIIKENETVHIRKYASPAREAVKGVYTPYEIGTTPYFREHIETLKPLITVEEEVEMLEAA